MNRSEKLTHITGWMARLDALADEMEAGGCLALAEHIDSITADLEFEQVTMLDEGPIVTFRGGTCVVRSATGN